MILKTSKDTYKNVAEKLELSVDLVSLIGDFVWGELGKHLENFDHREIYFKSFGNIRFRKKKSLEYVKRVKDIDIRMRQMKRPEEYIQTAVERVGKKVEGMQRLIKEWDNFMLEKEKFKEMKKQYYVERNIQEQGSNLG